MKIEIINKDWLLKLETLLSESFKEEVSINDELEYFEEINPNNWFIAIDNENSPIGFIRYFPITSDDFVQVELYAKNNLDIEIDLIKKIDKNIKNKVVRFCLKKNKSPKGAPVILKNNKTGLINYLTEIGYTDKVAEFKFYSYSKKDKINENSSIRFANNNHKEILEINDVLKEFQDFSEEKITGFINKNELIVCEKNNQIVCVAWNRIMDESMEIIEITTKKEFRRNGYAEELLEGIFSKYPDKNVTLKVKTENVSAIQLYEKVGFKEVIEEKELWISKNY